MVSNIIPETIVAAIKDALHCFQLPIFNCRGQMYDGASNMMGKNQEQLQKYLKWNLKC